LDPKHHSFGADFPDHGVSLLESIEALPESARELAQFREGFVQKIQEFQRDAAGKRTAAEGGAVGMRRQPLSGVFRE
jgi:hypothetical protein